MSLGIYDLLGAFSIHSENFELLVKIILKVLVRILQPIWENVLVVFLSEFEGKATFSMLTVICCGAMTH